MPFNRELSIKKSNRKKKVLNDFQIDIDYNIGSCTGKTSDCI